MAESKWVSPTAEALRKAKKEEEAKPVVMTRQSCNPNDFWDEAQRQLTAAHNTVEHARVAGARLYTIVSSGVVWVEACCHDEAMGWLTRHIYNCLEGKHATLIKGQRKYEARKQLNGVCSCMQCC